MTEVSRNNVAILNKAYDALSRGALDEWLDYCTPDVELHEVVEIPDSSVYRGRDELRRWAEATRELVDDWNWEPKEVMLDRGDLVLIRARVSGTGHGAGVPIDQIVFHAFDLKDGRVTRIRGFMDEATALEAA